jgi:hypothetical protein
VSFLGWSCWIAALVMQMGSKAVIMLQPFTACNNRGLWVRRLLLIFHYVFFLPYSVPQTRLQVTALESMCFSR